MCTKGHALIRVWQDARWWLACCNCTYKVLDHPQALKKEPK